MKNRAEEELKQIAIALFHDKIFTDRHIPERDSRSLLSVFMPLGFMKPSQMRKLQKDPPGMIFEYLDKAGPRSINGMPMFFSCQMLSQDDVKVVLDLRRKLGEAQKEALRT